MHWTCTSRELREQYEADATNPAGGPARERAAKFKARLSTLTPASYATRHAIGEDGVRWTCAPTRGGEFQLFRGWPGTQHPVVTREGVGRDRDALIRKYDPDATIEVSSVEPR